MVQNNSVAEEQGSIEVGKMNNPGSRVGNVKNGINDREETIKQENSKGKENGRKLSEKTKKKRKTKFN